MNGNEKKNLLSVTELLPQITELFFKGQIEEATLDTCIHLLLQHNNSYWKELDEP